MKTTPDCLPCLVRQAQLTAQSITEDPGKLFEAVQHASRLLPDVAREDTPAAASTYVAWATMQALGDDNPYAEKKRHYNALALEVYDDLKRFVQESPDPLEAAVRVAAMGNALDLSILEAVSVADLVQQLDATQWAVNDVDRLRADLAAAEQVLYLGDNAGEIVFDRVLVETLSTRRITFAVKGRPIVNDVTLDDAVQVRMDHAAEIIDTGSGYLGAPLEHCSPEFREIFAAADVIISKGQANFETLSHVEANIYFLLKAKCWPVARELGVRAGEIVLKSRLSGDLCARSAPR